MELPKTSAIVGTFAALEDRVMSRKSLPPGMKISFCVGRSAPPDSTSAMVGSRFSSAIWEARKIFLTVHGFEAPPFTDGSLAVIMHSTPSITPMPVTTLAPTVKSEPQPASGDSSRNALPGSISSSIRSRGISLPRSWCRVTDRSPPPATAIACCASSSAILASIDSRRLTWWSLVVDRSVGRACRNLAHDVYPSSRAERSVSTSVAPPPMPRIRASR